MYWSVESTELSVTLTRLLEKAMKFSPIAALVSDSLNSYDGAVNGRMRAGYTKVEFADWIIFLKADSRSSKITYSSRYDSNEVFVELVMFKTSVQMPKDP